ncbi:MAG: 16S rRNA (guanine(527)-N(7))-methyltransferase RsmG, partial [Actinomycetota bacterium]|nr:16S rRNA (guanine(527)-N(7))-methyltransferase RsmG [Actinomycetota bacterium]
MADSLSGLEVSDLARARHIADLGAGAGFPGLPLAIALPGAKVDLIESAGRKTAVIDRLIQAAKVDNARTVKARAEEWAAVTPALGGGREAYDAVTARAVASLAVVVEYAAPLLGVAGVLVAWKGAVGEEERQRGR